MIQNKIILLDLGGVVFQSTGISDEKIDWNIITQLNHKHGYDLNIGRDVFPTFLMEYNERTAQQLTGNEFLKSVFDTLEINQELLDMLVADYEIIIVSDNYRENIEYISKRYNFTNWAKQQIYSFDYEMIKSNTAFFQRLLKEVKHDRSDLIFIDDSPKKVESAKKSGIKGILFQSNAQIKEVLDISDI